MGRSMPDPNGPDDVDAAFAEIIAGLEQEGVGRDAGTLDGEDEDREATDRPPAGGTTQASGWRTSDAEWDVAALDDVDTGDTEHYMPPEPPPLPRLRVGTIVALVLTAIGVFLLVAPGAIGLPMQVSAPLALVLLASGLGLLLLRLRSGPPDGGPDGGAQL